MTCYYRPRFVKELAALPTHERRRVEHLAFTVAPAAATLQQLAQVKPLHGHALCFRIR